MGILGGALFGVAQADFTPGSRYIQSSLDALFLRDIMTGLIKSVMFGVNHYRRGLPRRAFHGRGRRAGRPVNHHGRWSFHLSGNLGGPGVYHAFFFVSEK